MKVRFSKVAMIATVVALFASSCAKSSTPSASPESAASAKRSGPTITVSSADFSESVILAEIYAQAMEAKGYTVDRKLRLGSREVIVPALKSGEVDFVPEYTGNALRFLTKADPPSEAEAIVTELRKAFAEVGATVLEASDAEDKDGQAVTKELANKLKLEKVSDLSGKSSDLVFGGPPECPERPACLKGLKDVYGLSFKDFKPLDGAARAAALEGGQVDVLQVFSTEGLIAQKNFVVLTDDKKIAGDQRVIPVVRDEIIKAYPELTQLLNSISAKLTTRSLTEMNKEVDVDKADADAVAKTWLKENKIV